MLVWSCDLHGRLAAISGHTNWQIEWWDKADCRRSMRMVHAAAVRLKADARQMRNVTRHEPSPAAKVSAEAVVGPANRTHC
jgi:hypothetical protein